MRLYDRHRYYFMLELYFTVLLQGRYSYTMLLCGSLEALRTELTELMD